MPHTRWRFRLPRPWQRQARAGARAYLAAIVDSSDDAIVAKDLDGVIQSWNAAAERIFGYPAAEAIGRPITLIIPPERHAEEVAILTRLRRGERVDHFETVRVARDGHLVPVSLTVSPIRDESGRVVGASKIARDITQQKRATEALNEQREWLQTTLESIGDAVLATEIQGTIVFMNSVAERLTGWSRADAVGRPCGEVFRIVNEMTREPAANPVHRAMAEGVVVGLANHSVLIARHGEERPIDDSAAPIRHPDGRVAGAVLVFRDVSERRRTEEERRRAMTERERLLEGERAARAEAERANRLKDEFVAIVSHELRTPLNAIVGWTELLAKDTTDADTRRRAVDVLRRNATIQAQLVSDLLDVSRMLSGKLQLALKSVDLSALLDDAVQMLQASADEKGVGLRRTTEGGGLVIGDFARLQQVMSNLLSNAVKFTPAGGAVEVALRRMEGYAEISVSDTGVGIKPEFLSSVFDRFRQADASAGRRFGGLGLGLAIVKQLVEMHGGTVRAESAGEGKGATFVVSLPVSMVAEASAGTGERRLAESDAPSPSEASLQGVKVLVVEDDDDTRDLLQRLLEEYGAAVVATGTAPEALSLLPITRPDVLVCDLGLPEMDGYQLIERIRAEDLGGPGLPAIAVTAFARSEDRRRALLAGYQAHVAKPVQPAELVATVASFADLISFRRSAAQQS
jgi:PAS domain S-box-containing protein